MNQFAEKMCKIAKIADEQNWEPAMQYPPFPIRKSPIKKSPFKKLLSLMFFSVSLWLPVVGSAHPLGAQCVAPDRPDNDQDNAAWQQFLTDVDNFRQCVSNVMRDHEDAAVEHRADARSIVDEWNYFVRASLNAPEDFPWPEPYSEAEEAE